MKIYNTASRTVEEFYPLEPGKVGIYCCGPTVYNFAHIGNMRTYVFEDVLRRTFEHIGYDVFHVMNITDVGHLQSDADDGEDKMALATQREKKSPWDIAKTYEAHFFRHAKMLGISRPHTVCRATEHINEIIEMVEALVQKNHAYEANGNVYFDVSTFPDYASFAKLHLDAQQSTERVDEDINKRSQADFCLWFSNSKFPNQIMKWDSPWGEGFPGWHIECSAMSAKYLGERFDIHCGGVDHIPVHHTNEIAQSNCCFDKQVVNYWMHGEFLIVDEGKMSKSAGNFLTVDTLVEKGFSPLAYRYLLLTGHYRKELRFSFQALEEANSAYQGLSEKVQTWQFEQTGNADVVFDELASGFQGEFWSAMTSDLSTPAALQVLWRVVRSKELLPGTKLALVREFDAVLGLGLSVLQRGELSDEEAMLIQKREVARANKDWQESDRLRDLLLEKGILVKDAKGETIWSRLSGSAGG